MGTFEEDPCPKCNRIGCEGAEYRSKGLPPGQNLKGLENMDILRGYIHRAFNYGAGEPQRLAMIDVKTSWTECCVAAFLIGRNPKGDVSVAALVDRHILFYQEMTPEVAKTQPYKPSEVAAALLGRYQEFLRMVPPSGLTP
jgi:hypothetical protein